MDKPAKPFPGVEHITFKVVAEADDSQYIEGSFNSGDPEADRLTVEEIRTRFARGDVWAWASVKVVAIINEFQAESDWLGSCSYLSEEEFIEADDYYTEMCGQAKVRLLTTIAETQSALDRLPEELLNTAKRFI